MTKKLLIALTSITGAVAISTAVAVSVVASQYNVGDAVYLSWGENQSTTLEGLSSLTDTPQFRTINVGKTTTNLTSGFTTITFTLTPSENKTLEGVKISIYKDISSSSDIGSDTNVFKVVEGSSENVVTTIDSISIEGMKETTSYLLSFTYGGEENVVDDTSSSSVGGTLSINLGWKESE